MARHRFLPTKRRTPNEECTSSVRLAHVCKEPGEDHDQHQVASGPLYRGTVARSSATGEGPFYFRRGWRYSDLGDQRGHFHDRPVYGRRAWCAAGASMPGTPCAELQRFDTTCRTKEAAAPPYWRLRRVGLGQHISANS